jgi:hypothetical protein
MVFGFLHKNLGGQERAAPACRMGRILALAGCLSLGACGSAVDFSQWAAGYNKAVERTQNENLFLNMVRAAYNRPMHFATVSVVRGNGQVTPSFSATMPFNQFSALARNGAILTPAFTVTSGFNFDMASLDTSEFLAGLLTQVSPAVIDYYVSQGIPRELLFNLFIERIEIATNDKTETFLNDPNTRDHERFTEVLHGLLDSGFTTETLTLRIPVGPALTAAEAKDPLRLQAVAQTGMAVEEAGGGYQIIKTANASRFCFWAQGEALKKLPNTALCGAADRPVGQAGEKIGSSLEGRQDASLKVVTRSARGVFNYLGNLIYQQVGSPAPYRLPLTSEEAKNYNYLGRGDSLIYVLKDERQDNDLVQVEFDGATYSVPADKQGHSALVMAIVSQVLSLNKSVNSIPTTSAVVVR